MFVAIARGFFLVSILCYSSGAETLVTTEGHGVNDDPRWAFLKGDSEPWVQKGITRDAVEIAVLNGTRITILKGEIYVEEVGGQGKSHEKRLRLHLEALQAVVASGRLPDVEFVLNTNDIPGDLQLGSAPIFGQARFSKKTTEQKGWLLPDADTFRSKGGSIEDVLTKSEIPWVGRRPNVFWRGQARINLFPNGKLDYNGGNGNWRRTSLLTTCLQQKWNINSTGSELVAEEYAFPMPSASSDFLLSNGYAKKPDYVTIQVGGTNLTHLEPRRVEVNRYLKKMLDKIKGGKKGTNVILNIPPLVTHVEMCDNQALIYLDGRSTSNGLKYLLACQAPILVDAASMYEDFISVAWPRALGVESLVHQRDVMLVGKQEDDYKTKTEEERIYLERSFCSDVSSSLSWLQDHPDKAAEMGRRNGFVAQQIGSVTAVLDYIETALSYYASLQKYTVSDPPRGVRHRSVLLDKELDKEFLRLKRSQVRLGLHKAKVKQDPDELVAETALYVDHPQGHNRSGSAGVSAGELLAGKGVGKLKWLHIPKAGSSFGNALYHSQCPSLPKDAIIEEPPSLTKWSHTHKQLHVAKNFAERFRLASCGEGLFVNAKNSPADHGALELRHEGHAVGFFREPTDRLVSAYHYDMLIPGTKSTDKILIKDVEDFSKWPGAAHCQSKLLIGHACGESNVFKNSTRLQRLESARFALVASSLVSSLRFVGVTEFWQASIDLWHAMVGGESSPSDYADIRPGNYSTSVKNIDSALAQVLTHTQWRLKYGKSTELAGWIDAPDSIVYMAALNKFQADCAAHNIDMSKHGAGTVVSDYMPVYEIARESLGIGRHQSSVSLFQLALPKIKWLHIPKCGTSFANTMFQMSCTRLPSDAKLESVESCMALTLGDKGAKELFSLNISTDSRKEQILKETKQTGVRCTDPAGHLAAKHGVVSCGKGFFTDNSGDPASHAPRSKAHAGSVVTMLREPTERLVSAFEHSEGSFAPGAPGDLRATVKTLQDFATYPGTAGCQTKMLIGRACGSPKLPTAQEVEMAVSIVNSERFVGIVEAWNTSVDLFHAMFKSVKKALPFEYENVRPGLGLRWSVQSYSNVTWRERFGTHGAKLREHVDAVDRIVYLAALRRFRADCEIFLPLERRGSVEELVSTYELEHKSPKIQALIDRFWNVLGDPEKPTSELDVPAAHHKKKIKKSASGGQVKQSLHVATHVPAQKKGDRRHVQLTREKTNKKGNT